jgi:hypothetical protein
MGSTAQIDSKFVCIQKATHFRRQTLGNEASLLTLIRNTGTYLVGLCRFEFRRRV